MNHSDVIRRFLFPTDLNTSESIEPTVSALNNPTPCLHPRFVSNIRRFLAPSPDVKRITEFLRKVFYLVPDITGVQTKMLSMIRFHLRTVNRNTCKRLSSQFYIMPIRSVHHKSDWNPVLIGQYTSFNPKFTAICWIAPCFFPRQAAISSSLHPLIATSSRFRFFHRISKDQSPRVFEKNQPSSILENANEPSKTNKSPSRSTHSIESPFWQQKEWRQTPSDRRPAGVLLCLDLCAHVSEYMALSFPKLRPTPDRNSS